MFKNAECLPLRVTRPQTLGAECLRFGNRDFIISNKDRLATATVLPVQSLFD